MPRNKIDLDSIPPERKPARASGASGRKCGGSTKRGTATCRHPAGYHTPHAGWGRCYLHGGSTEAGRQYAAKLQAAGLAKFYGEPVDTDPITALLEEVCRTAGHVAWLGQKISGWQSGLDDDGGVPEVLQFWLQEYRSERRHLVSVSKATLDAGVNERLVRIAEHQGMRLADAIEEILLALHLTSEQQQLIPGVVPRVLRGLVSPVIEGEVVK